MEITFFSSDVELNYCYAIPIHIMADIHTQNPDIKKERVLGSGEGKRAEDLT